MMQKLSNTITYAQQQYKIKKLIQQANAFYMRTLYVLGQCIMWVYYLF